MGRYVSGGANSVPRSMIVPCYASDPAIAVPPWAQGGRGVVRVTGVGAGASGNVGITNANTIYGGGAGAIARDHIMAIPAGVATIAAEIGVGGAKVTAAIAADGNPGGHTKLTIGTSILLLQGGGNGLSSRNYRGGVPLCGKSITPYTEPLNSPPGMGMFGSTDKYAAGGVGSGPSSLAIGADGGHSFQSDGFGTGGMSPWGSCPIRLKPVSGSTNGYDASGYGAGGQGAFWESGAAVSSGKGADGFLLLEFVEGA